MMQVTKAKKYCSILFIALLFLPIFQKASRLFPTFDLYGVEVPINPIFNATTWFSGEYSEKYRKRFAAKIGFRGLFVKLVNQFNYSVHGEMPKVSGPEVVIGKKGWLYEQSYITNYINPQKIDEQKLAGFVKDLQILQDKLAKRRIVFILLISPNKAAVYPEYLPDELRIQAEKNNKESSISILRPMLKGSDIRFVEAGEIFRLLKQDTEYLFPPGGTHWSYYGSFLISQELLEKARQANFFSVSIPHLTSVTYHSPLGTDTDVQDFTNLFWFKGYQRIELPYPEVKSNISPLSNRLNILMVGDSFSRTMLDSFYLSKIIHKADLFSYYSSLFSNPIVDGNKWYNVAKNRGLIDHKDIDWEEYLLNRQILILQINEAAIHSTYDNTGPHGYPSKFVKDALKVLSQKSKQPTTRSLDK